MKNIIKRISVAIVFMIIFSMFSPCFYSGNNMINIAEATTVKINKTKLKIKVGESYKLEISGTKANIKWKSAGKSIATVSKLLQSHIGVIYQRELHLNMILNLILIE